MQPVNPSYRVSLFLHALAATTIIMATTGCAVTSMGPNPAAVGSTISGQVHGGQQPVSGSKIYLYAASNAGYSAPATSLLGGGGYVTTDSGGNFSITGTYTCPVGAYVYVLALGGNPGLAPGTNNPDLALMNGLGPCSGLQASTFIPINEVTTVATAYSLAQFMSSETLVGTSSTNAIGLQNAFATINNLFSTPQGFALATTPAGNGVVPQTEINSLANALAACVNSDGTGAACSSLMTAANVTGAGGTPIDTIQAAINIAQNPGTNVAAIYANSTPNAPFQPALSTAPNDSSMSIVYSGGGQGRFSGIAVDAAGNIWATDFFIGTVTELSPLGAFLAPGTGYSNGLFGTTASGLGIDMSGNVWVAAGNPYSFPSPYGSVMEFSSNGRLLSGTTGFLSQCLNNPQNIVVDPSNNVWTAGSSGLCKLNSGGSFLSPTSGFTGGGYPQQPEAIAVDPAGNIWANGSNYTISGNSTVYTWVLAKFDPNGNALSPSAGFQQGGGGNFGNGVAIDHLGNAWVSSDVISSDGNTFVSGSISKFSGAGALLSPTAGYGTLPAEWVAVDGAGQVWGNSPVPSGNSALIELGSNGTQLSPANGFGVPYGGIYGAIDASGNLWESGQLAIVETIGLAAPVMTPIAKAVATNSLGIRP